MNGRLGFDNFFGNDSLDEPNKIEEFYLFKKLVENAKL